MNKVALSAQHYGWTYARFSELIFERQPRVVSQLGWQLLNPKRRTRTRADAEKYLRRIWRDAEKYRQNNPAKDRDEMAGEALDRAKAAQAAAADADNDLTDDERAVLHHVGELAETRKLIRLALPWRPMAEATGLNPRRTRDARDRLTARGVLWLDQRGRSSRAEGPRRANLYTAQLPARCGCAAPTISAGNRVCG